MIESITFAKSPDLIPLGNIGSNRLVRYIQQAGLVITGCLKDALMFRFMVSGQNFVSFISAAETVSVQPVTEYDLKHIFVRNIESGEVVTIRFEETS